MRWRIWSGNEVGCQGGRRGALGRGRRGRLAGEGDMLLVLPTTMTTTTTTIIRSGKSGTFRSAQPVPPILPHFLEGIKSSGEDRSEAKQSEAKRGQGLRSSDHRLTLSSNTYSVCLSVCLSLKLNYVFTPTPTPTPPPPPPPNA